jgi:hypothetical protein
MNVTLHASLHVIPFFCFTIGFNLLAQWQDTMFRHNISDNAECKEVLPGAILRYMHGVIHCKLLSAVYVQQNVDQL